MAASETGDRVSAKIQDEFSSIPDPRRRAALRAKARGLCWCGRVPKEGRKCCQRCIDRAMAHIKKKAIDYANQPTGE